MSKHTPGPWRAACRRGYAGVFGGDANNGIAVADCRTVDVDLPTATANAQLIAAAPDLLASLREMVDIFERRVNDEPGPDDAAERWDRARDAIKKAIGE